MLPNTETGVKRLRAKLNINLNQTLGGISPHTYGNFAEHLGRCIYGGIWVGPQSKIPNEGGIRTDVAGALKDLGLPVLRWPGGCFADNYHWQWGVGAAEKRRPRHNLWWAQPEPNEFGTDEFIRLCRMVGCEPYICLNVGSGTVEEALGWVEYCNSDQDTYYTRLRRENGARDPYRVRFWGIGNENWGCGGSMTPEQYAYEYRKYATYLRAMDNTVPGGLFLIACGFHDDWNFRFLREMRGATHLLDAFSLHLYVGGYSRSATEFTDEDHYRLMGDVLFMETEVARACHLARYYSTFGRQIYVVVDEWGTWYPEANVASGLYQQNALRDALFTACALNMFNRHCDCVFMTNMAQTVNVLQSLILTQGSKMVLTPTYWAYYMFRGHMGGTAVACETDAPTIQDNQGRAVPVLSASASVKDGTLFLTLANIHLTAPVSVEVGLLGGSASGQACVSILTSRDVRDHNSFEAPNRVVPRAKKAAAAGASWRFRLPPMAVGAIAVGLS
ncbi:MAG: alpha-N-arabinofuranosidase [Armatimonadetes bacterium]|nr:alpha-N-arabinofuranosidase [Armatimonadota bacterium]